MRCLLPFQTQKKIKRRKLRRQRIHTRHRMLTEHQSRFLVPYPHNPSKKEMLKKKMSRSLTHRLQRKLMISFLFPLFYNQAWSALILNAKPSMTHSVKLRILLFITSPVALFLLMTPLFGICSLHKLSASLTTIFSPVNAMQYYLQSITANGYCPASMDPTTWSKHSLLWQRTFHMSS